MILESTLVKKHRPRYNIILRDDKHYPFLKLTTNEEFPRLVVARRVQKDGASYFGPVLSRPPRCARRCDWCGSCFPSAPAASRSTARLSRPCLQYFIHRCNAPCTGWETARGLRRAR